MRSFTIKNTAAFMNGLLSERETVFDQFLLSEAVIVTGNTYTIDGHLNSEFYTGDELDELRLQASSNGRIFSEDMIRWESAKGYCHDLIRGRKTPLMLKITFCLAPENIIKFMKGIDTAMTPSDISSLNVNIKYDGSTLTCTTAVSLKIFTMDRTVGKAYDDMFGRFLYVNGYEYEAV